MKKWYQSKTIWVNLIAGVLGLLPVIDNNLLTAIGLTDPSRWLVIVGSITTALNILLRLVTTKAIDTTSVAK